MKRALLIGINYENTEHSLRGCINDTRLMDDILRNKFRFDTIEKLLEKDATTKNIISVLERLVRDSKSGDTLYIHYSGHGSQIPDGYSVSDGYNNNVLDGEVDRLDEIICPIDLDWRDNIIRDDDFNRIFSVLEEGVHLTVVLDCCHSGDGLRGLVNPILDNPEDNPIEYRKSRYLELPDSLESPDLLDRSLESSRSLGSMIIEYSGQKGILISGCRSNQTSADAYINGSYNGALTYCLVQLLEQNPRISYRDLVERLNQLMVQGRFTQSPELNCDSRYFEQLFLGGYSEAF